MPQGVPFFLVAYIVLDGTGLMVGRGEVGEVKRILPSIER